MFANPLPLAHSGDMKMRHALLLMVVTCALACGAGPRKPDNNPPVKTPGEGAKPTGSTGAGVDVQATAETPVDEVKVAQAKLPVMKLLIGKTGSKVVAAEIAVREHQRRCGMMFRKELPDGEGMLFVFLQPSRQGFYMKNTSVPLSIAYIGSTGRLLEIHDLEPLNESAVESATELVQYALEVPRDWFKRNNVNIGDVIRAEQGTFDEVFFGK